VGVAASFVCLSVYSKSKWMEVLQFWSYMSFVKRKNYGVGGFCFVTEEKSVFFSLLGVSKSTKSNGLMNLTYENFCP
jgi:hypothetical protein